MTGHFMFNVLLELLVKWAKLGALHSVKYAHAPVTLYYSGVQWCTVRTVSQSVTHS